MENAAVALISAIIASLTTILVAHLKRKLQRRSDSQRLLEDRKQAQIRVWEKFIHLAVTMTAPEGQFLNIEARHATSKARKASAKRLAERAVAMELHVEVQRWFGQRELLHSLTNAIVLIAQSRYGDDALWEAARASFRICQLLLLQHIMRTVEESTGKTVDTGTTTAEQIPHELKPHELTRGSIMPGEIYTLARPSVGERLHNIRVVTSSSG